MTNGQLLVGLAALMATLLGAQLATIKWYVDARFNSIDTQLKFLIDHAVTHGERIAGLEARNK
jgi:hypothetical protein